MKKKSLSMMLMVLVGMNRCLRAIPADFLIPNNKKTMMDFINSVIDDYVNIDP